MKCPRLSSDTALIEAVWDAMIETGILPEASFIQVRDRVAFPEFVGFLSGLGEVLTGRKAWEGACCR